MMEDTANFNTHIDKVCKKVRQKCGWILRTFYCRNPAFLRHMWNTYLQPHIDYCSQLWAPQDGVNLNRLEKLLQSFTARIPAVQSLNYWDRFKELRMNSEQRRLERYKIIYSWKVLEGKVPNCGLEREDSLRNGRVIKVRPLKKLGTTLREASFQETGPKLFNCLPQEIRIMKNMEIYEFKMALDDFLSGIPDQPKAPGLTPAAMTATAEHSISLLHQVALTTRQRTRGT